MEDLKIRLRRLLDKPEWTEEDRQWLLTYLENTEASELSSLVLQKYSEGEWPPRQIDPEISKEMLEGIHERLGLRRPSRRIPVFHMRTVRIAAACLAGLLIVGIYWRLSKRREELAGNQLASRQSSRYFKSDIPPGGNKAILTLADGSKITLDDAKNGALAQQGNTKVLKLDGQLSYNATKNNNDGIYFNTIVTPRGGQYEIVLQDGTKVWLDAASSLRFPTAFAGKERRVEITGEAYFEVAKNATMPFIVKVGRSEVQVLGTEFNIMAYDEEASLKTTLLEGSVKFVNDGRSSLLTPGQQSSMDREGKVHIENKIDLVEVMAWKNGLFHFESADIQTVMRQLSRWYDVDVVYSNKGSVNLFYAEIPRNTNLSDALKALQLTGKVHFEIEGRKIIVTQ